MVKVRILIDCRNKGPYWANTYIFINEKYQDMVQSFNYTLSIETLGKLEIKYVYHTQTFSEGIDDIKMSPVYNWKEILEARK